MKKLFLMLGALLLTATSVSAQEWNIQGEPFILSEGNGCSIDAPRNYYSFSSQWASTSPSVTSFKVAEVEKIVIEFEKPLQWYFNMPYKLITTTEDAETGEVKTTETQKWNAYNDQKGGKDDYMSNNILEIDLSLLGDIKDFGIQNTQSTGTETNFTILNSYYVTVDGQEHPLTWSGAKAKPATSAKGKCSSQWGGINVSNDIIGKAGKKTLRIYSNGDLTALPIQWCIRTKGGADAWPQIGIIDEHTAECYITETLSSIFLQYTSATASDFDIAAITYELAAIDDTTDPEPEIGTGNIVASLTAREATGDKVCGPDDEVTVVSAAGATQDWDRQFFISFDGNIPEGEKITVSFDYSASKATNVGTQSHGNPGSYNYWDCIGSVAFTTEWKTFNKTVTVSSQMVGNNGFKSIAFNLAVNKSADVEFYIKNVKVIGPKYVYPATVEVGEAQYATFYAPFDCDLTKAGVKAYYVGGVQNGVLELTDCPYADAYQPVLVYSETPVSYKFTGEKAASREAKGLLKGTLYSIAAPVGSYVLQNNDKKVGFYKVAKETTSRVKANRAYLEVPASAAGVKAFSLNDANAINAVEALTSGKAQIFDMSGRKLNKFQKGINIVNGVKVLVK